MNEPKRRYPLMWPEGWKRTPYSKRQRPKWHGTTQKSYTSGDQVRYYRDKKELSVADAIARLDGELRRLRIRDGDWLISSNVPVRMDGLPYSNARQPDDPGVAVYFRLNGQDRVLACDAWTSVAGNIAAVAAHVEAIRGIERYGVGTLEQAFLGYAALPAKGSTWRSTLGFNPTEPVTRDQIDVHFRNRSRTAHPDVPGGSHDAMASLSQAKTEALAELERIQQAL